MKKIAILSSYSESCGNAAFTKILHDSIEKYTDTSVEVIELNLPLLQSVHPEVRKRGDEHINQICEILVQYEAVNIQLEAGLFGSLERDIVKRTKKVMSANKNTSVTLHSPRLVYSQPTVSRKGAFKMILRGNFFDGFKSLFFRSSQPYIATNHAMIRHAVQNELELIVHTERAKRQIKAFFDYDNVNIHPLVMVDDDFRATNSELAKIKDQLGLTDNDLTIGMFGYINEYKGHSDAINALAYLPDNFKLLVFGRQHPQSIRNSQSDPYLKKLIKQITSQPSEKSVNKKTMPLRNRVFFMGELDDDTFVKVASGVDVAWLPYYENGQDGSGIASICLDVCKRVLCSTSFAFDELFKLKFYKNVRRFDIGNELEIATKTLMFLKEADATTPYGDISSYNIETQATLYASVV